VASVPRGAPRQGTALGPESGKKRVAGEADDGSHGEK
jgi:hypothetical protein